METTLKPATTWRVPEPTGIPVRTNTGSEGQQTLRVASREVPTKQAMPKGTREYRIPNLARACQILRLFASTEDKLSSSAVARKLKMPRTTVLRILHTLAAERFLQRRGFDFTASTELRTGLRSLDENVVRMAAIPVLEDLSRITGESAHLALFSGPKAVVVETCEGSNVRPNGWTRAPVDLHCSSVGKVFLAFASTANLDALLATPLPPRTRQTLTTAEALKAECSRIAREGYAVDNEEQEEGMRSLAAPVWGSGGSLVAAVAVSGPAMTLSEPRLSDIAAQVVQAAKRLSASLSR